MLIGVTFLSERLRWVLTAVLGRLLDVDIEFVFENPRKAGPNLRQELAKARDVRVFTGRGGELQRETFADSLTKGRSGQIKMRILLPAVRTEQGRRWTLDRERELASFDTAYVAGGILERQIEASALFVAGYASDTLILRRFEFPHIGRIVLTDRCAFLTPYRSDRHGRDSIVFKYRRGGEHYEFLARIFEKSWDASLADPMRSAL